MTERAVGNAMERAGYRVREGGGGVFRTKDMNDFTIAPDRGVGCRVPERPAKTQMACRTAGGDDARRDGSTICEGS